MRYCSEVVLPLEPADTLRVFKHRSNNVYGKVNLSLASDDKAKLRYYRDFIKKLRASIIVQPLLDDGTYFWGVDMPKTEIKNMELLQKFLYSNFSFHLFR